jgi:hypothetical protein
MRLYMRAKTNVISLRNVADASGVSLNALKIQNQARRFYRLQVHF